METSFFFWQVAPTDVSVFHGSDVRPQSAVCGGQKSLHAWLQLVQCHSKAGEVVHLVRKQKGKSSFMLASGIFIICLKAKRISSCHFATPNSCSNYESELLSRCCKEDKQDGSEWCDVCMHLRPKRKALKDRKGRRC